MILVSISCNFLHYSANEEQIVKCWDLTESSSVKGKNIQSDPRVIICVDYQEYPYSFVTIFGEAEPFKRYIEPPNAEDKKVSEEFNDFLGWEESQQDMEVQKKLTDMPGGTAT